MQSLNTFMRRGAMLINNHNEHCGFSKRFELVHEGLGKSFAELGVSGTDSRKLAFLRDQYDAEIRYTDHELARLSVEPANLSQHLTVLRSKQVVVSRKAGNQVYYTLRDTVLLEVLDLLKRYFNAHLQQSAGMPDAMDAEQGRPE